ncbi:hypothetical protein PIB30_085301 [Stylosanthes scabra]|uniref:PABS domain-containing protein n=1 Tax=Stylosanthes scabra TaxID=79078 RepID=A0ABU6WUJ4_9FABA|nr:hypothetical protein [Stylosanthes scabra]
MNLTEICFGSTQSDVTKSFYEFTVKPRLKEGGIFVTQAGPAGIFSHTEVFSSIYNTLRQVFKYIVPYTAYIPSYADIWGWVMASDSPIDLSVEELDHRMRQRIKGENRYLDGKTFSSASTLSKVVRKSLDNETHVYTEEAARFIHGHGKQGLLANELDLNGADILANGPEVLTNTLATRVDLLRVDTILRVQVLDLTVGEQPVELSSSTWAYLNSPPVLPPNFGDGVFGSSSGGVNSTGASSFSAAGAAASTISSAAEALMVANLSWAFWVVKDTTGDCYHGQSPALGAERGGVKREACVAIAIGE